MNIEIEARTADDQMLARSILGRCLPDNVFSYIWVNCWNDGQWYAICKRRLSLGGGYLTVGIDPKKQILTH